jgi:hypothetical protein
VVRLLSRLIHDPGDDRALLQGVFRRATPDIREQLDRQFPGDPPIPDDAAHERKRQHVRALEQHAEGRLIPEIDCVNEIDPLAFRDQRTPLA